MKQPKVSIILALFNNWKYTFNCLQSLEKDTYTNKEIIILDNNSTDETLEKLPEFIKQSPLNIKVIWNKTNLGFAKANNIGLRMAKGEYIVLLNNDTYVTKGWIEGLIIHANKQGVGLVGPVTNNIGNEAKIDVLYESGNWDEMHRITKEYTTLHKGETLPAQTVAAFCWMMKRSVFNKVGYLDERFEQGWFEDDDYCRRIKIAGLKVLIAEDVFVHHEGGKSFSLMKKDELTSLFNKNKKKFEEKWQTQWIPHHYRIEIREIKQILKKIMKVSVQIKSIRQDLLIDEGYPLFRLFQPFKKFLSYKELDVEPFDYNKYLNLRGKEKLKKRLEKLKKYYRKLRSLQSSVLYIPFQIYHRFESVPKATRMIRTLWTISKILPPLPGKPDIVICSIIGYLFRHQRPQHLAEQLAKRGHRVFYLDHQFITQNTLDKDHYEIKKIKKNIYLCKLTAHNNLNIYIEKPTREDKKTILISFCKFVKDAGLTNFILKIDHPFWGYIFNSSKFKIMYDCMDDHESFEMSSDELVKIESKIAREARAVTAASDHLYLKMKKFHPKMLALVKNAGEYTHFAVAQNKTQLKPPDIKQCKGKIIGYYGAIAEWFDAEIVIRLAKEYPSHSIVLIGAVTHETLRGVASKFNNVFLLGEKPYKELPNYSANFDVCLIPFVINDLIKATNPVKIYEYFAAGKPVVATDLPELHNIKDFVYLAKNNDEFVELTKKALEEKDPSLTKKRIDYAKENTWDKRGEVLYTIIEKLQHQESLR